MHTAHTFACSAICSVRAWTRCPASKGIANPPAIAKETIVPACPSSKSCIALASSAPSTHVPSPGVPAAASGARLSEVCEKRHLAESHLATPPPAAAANPRALAPPPAPWGGLGGEQHPGQNRKQEVSNTLAAFSEAAARAAAARAAAASATEVVRASSAAADASCLCGRVWCSGGYGRGTNFVY